MRRHWILAGLLAFGIACGGSFNGATGTGPHESSSSPREEGGGAQMGPSPTFGTLSINLVDAPKPEVTEIFVSIARVEADLPDGTVATISDSPVTVDLLTLQHGNFLPLGNTTVPAGEVSRIRLLLDDSIGHWVTLADGSQAPLKVPSGEASGIKMDGPFTVDACSNTTVTLDFDGEKSVNVHPTGKNDQYILRPVVFVKQVEAEPTPCPEPELDLDGGTSDADAGIADETDAGTIDDPDAGVSIN